MAEQDDDRERQRAAILQRRAKLVACAIATGVAAAQGGCTCLSPVIPAEGAGAVAGSPLNPCLSGESGGSGGAAAEDSAGAGAGGTVGAASAGGESAGGGTTLQAIGGEGGGGPTLCLSVK